MNIMNNTIFDDEDILKVYTEFIKYMDSYNDIVVKSVLWNVHDSPYTNFIATHFRSSPSNHYIDTTTGRIHSPWLQNGEYPRNIMCRYVRDFVFIYSWDRNYIDHYESNKQ